mgnify:CR=1 FL=1
MKRIERLTSRQLERNRETDKKYQRKKRLDNKGWKSQQNLEYRIKNKEKVEAQRIINYNINNGKIKRMPCESCNSILAQAHHDNYSKPLDVRWLCASHHKLFHLSVSVVELQI